MNHGVDLHSNRRSSSVENIRHCIVALSTCESEYIALADAAKELIWQQQLLKTLHVPQSQSLIHCDNQSAIATASTMAITGCSKHIDVRYDFLRELLINKTMILASPAPRTCWPTSSPSHQTSMPSVSLCQPSCILVKKGDQLHDIPALGEC